MFSSSGGTQNESEVERAIIFTSRGSVDASRCSLTLARVKQRLNFPAFVNVNKGNNKLSADVASFKKLEKITDILTKNNFNYLYLCVNLEIPKSIRAVI